VPSGIAGRTDLRVCVQGFENGDPFGGPECLAVSVASGVPLTVELTGPTEAAPNTVATFEVAGTTPDLAGTEGRFGVFATNAADTLVSGTISPAAAGGDSYVGSFSFPVLEAYAGQTLFVLAGVKAAGQNAQDSLLVNVTQLPPVTADLAWAPRELFLTEGVAAPVEFRATYSRLGGNILSASRLDWVLKDAADPS